MREREREGEDLVCQIHKNGYKKDWIIVDIFYSLRGVGEGDLDLLGGGGGGTALIDKTINICKRKGPRFGSKLTVEKSLLKKAIWLMFFFFSPKDFTSDKVENETLGTEFLDYGRHQISYEDFLDKVMIYVIIKVLLILYRIKNFHIHFNCMREKI